MHGESVVTGLRRSGELGLESLHVEGRLALLIKDRLVKLLEGERRHSHLALLGIAEESIPLGGLLAGVVRGENQGRQDRFFFDGNRLAVSALDGLLLAAHESLKIIFGRVDVLEIQLVDSGDILSTRGNETALDNESNQRRRNNAAFTSNFEESLVDAEERKLLANSDTGLVLFFGEKILANGEGSSLRVGQVHELLDGHVSLGAALDSRGDLGCEMRKLEKRRGLGRDGLNEVLVGVERTLNGANVTVGESDGGEGLVQHAGDGDNFVLGLGQRSVVEFNTAKVSPQQSQSLAADAVVEVLKLILVLDSESSGEGRGVTVSSNARLNLREARFGLVALEDILVFLASAQGRDDTTLVHVLIVLAEEVVCALHEDAFLGALHGSVPPGSDQVRQQDTKQAGVEQDQVFAVAV